MSKKGNTPWFVLSIVSISIQLVAVDYRARAALALADVFCLQARGIDVTAAAGIQLGIDTRSRKFHVTTAVGMGFHILCGKHPYHYIAAAACMCCKVVTR